jgi:ABC-type transport system substrate-binding protein
LSTRQHRLRAWSPAVLAAALAWGAAASGGAPAAAGTTAGGTVTMAMDSNIATMDPADWTDIPSMYVMDEVYSTLVTYAKDSTRIVPDLATSWSVTNGGRTYVFQLDPNARFSNGDPVTAQDVKFSLDRVTSYDASGQGPAPYGSSYSDIVGYAAWFNNGSPPAKGVTGLSGVKVLGPHTLEIDLVQPEGAFLNTLALMSAVVLDPAVVNRWGAKEYTYHAVGSGPFEVQSWVPGHQMVLVPNPYYDGSKPRVSKVVVEENVNPQLQLLRFEKGQLAFDLNIDSGTYLTIRSSPSLSKLFYKTPYNEFVFLKMNLSHTPMQNRLVRQALNYAVNKDLLVRVVLNGLGQPASQVLPPHVPGYNPALKPYPYNPGLARQLLAKAGYPNGLTLNYYYLSANPDVVRMAQILQQTTAPAGIHLVLHPISQIGTYFPFIINPKNDWDLAYSNWPQDYPNAQDFLFNLYQRLLTLNPNASQWVDTPRFGQLIAEADALPQSQAAAADRLYAQADAIARQNAYWVYLYYPDQEALVQPWMVPQDINVYMHPVKGPQFQYMSVPNGR